MAAESFLSRSTRFIPALQLPATKRAAHQTMGSGSSHTHHGFFRTAIESKITLLFAENKKAPEAHGENPQASGGVNGLI